MRSLRAADKSAELRRSGWGVNHFAGFVFVMIGARVCYVLHGNRGETSIFWDILEMFWTWGVR